MRVLNISNNRVGLKRQLDCRALQYREEGEREKERKSDREEVAIVDRDSPSGTDSLVYPQSGTPRDLTVPGTQLPWRCKEDGTAYTSPYRGTAISDIRYSS